MQSCCASPVLAPTGRRQALQVPGNSQVESAEDAAGALPIQSPLFNPGFAAALQTALKRTGTDVLATGPPKTEEDERRPTAQEEVLHGALHSCRQNVRQLERIKKDVEAALAREKAQFDSLHFALKKAKSDSAYLRTTEMLLEKARAEARERQQ
ncbi:hypothetical protein WJX72_006445 [[Myrmecia] bisecta]|uniref:Uncharacterized protein n=1 Tax=[Myrmecia] bisecta TaxID=41462 RepID=A0AAW1R7M2_9CHLO